MAVTASLQADEKEVSRAVDIALASKGGQLEPEDVFKGFSDWSTKSQAQVCAAAIKYGLREGSRGNEELASGLAVCLTLEQAKYITRPVLREALTWICQSKRQVVIKNLGEVLAKCLTVSTKMFQATLKKAHPRLKHKSNLTTVLTYWLSEGLPGMESVSVFLSQWTRGDFVPEHEDAHVARWLRLLAVFDGEDTALTRYATLAGKVSSATMRLALRFLARSPSRARRSLAELLGYIGSSARRLHDDPEASPVARVDGLASLGVIRPFALLEHTALVGKALERVMSQPRGIDVLMKIQSSHFLLAGLIGVGHDRGSKVQPILLRRLRQLQLKNELVGPIQHAYTLIANTMKSEEVITALRSDVSGVFALSIMAYRWQLKDDNERRMCVLLIGQRLLSYPEQIAWATVVAGGYYDLKRDLKETAAYLREVGRRH